VALVSLLGTGATSSGSATSLIDQDGRPFSLGALRGRTVVLNFIFTHCPSICPSQMQTLVEIQRSLPAAVAEQVRFVSISIDPERDTPEVLRHFAASLGVDGSRWTLVTGPAADLAELERNYGVRIKEPGASPFNHRVAIHLLGPDGRLLQTYTGVVDRKRVAREIEDADRLFRGSR
jgi:protein SCO1/2